MTVVPPPRLTCGTEWEFGPREYRWVEYSDDWGAVTNEPDNGQFAGQKFIFTVLDNPNDINQLSFTYEGEAGRWNTSGPPPPEGPYFGFRIYAWNRNSQAWTLLVHNNNSGEQTVTVSWAQGNAGDLTPTGTSPYLLYPISRPSHPMPPIFGQTTLNLSSKHR